jgi:predicted exporter
VSALGMPRDPSWQLEDERVRSLVARMDSGKFVVASGRDEQAALVANDEVFRRLEAARAAGDVQAFQSLHPFLPSAALQQRNLAALAARPDLAGALERAFREAGFRAGAFDGFRRALASAPRPLEYADLAGSPLAAIAAPFRVQLGEQVAFLTFVRGVADPLRFEQRLAGLDGVYYFDQKTFLQELYAGYRERVTLLIPVGLVVVLGMLWLHFRRVRTALATLLPALVSAIAAVGLLALAGVSLNLLHVLAILLVLSMGEDYAIFLVAVGDDPRQRAASMLSLCYACASTCLSFGLLAFSSFPALQALGAVTGIGVLLSLITAPAVLLLLRPTPGR